MQERYEAFKRHGTNEYHSTCGDEEWKKHIEDVEAWIVSQKTKQVSTQEDNTIYISDNDYEEWKKQVEEVEVWRDILKNINHTNFTT